jgi:prepilin signal peptidase PulO-like enzyme (type II secretory pathway)
LTVEDVKTQTVSVTKLGIFGAVTLLWLVYNQEWQGIGTGLTLIIILGMCFTVTHLLNKKAPFGAGDFIVLPLCGLWLALPELSLFLILTGCMGLIFAIIWRLRWDMRTFPMVPAIIAGWGGTLLSRCF